MIRWYQSLFGYVGTYDGTSFTHIHPQITAQFIIDTIEVIVLFSIFYSPLTYILSSKERKEEIRRIMKDECGY